MTRAERICLWIYAIMVALCVVFFRPIEKLLAWTSLGNTEEVLTVIFSLIGTVMIFATGGKKHIGASIGVSIFNFYVTGAVFYGVAWILGNILP